MSSQQVLIIVGGLLLGGLFMVVRSGRREWFLPPGPPTLPVIGNLHVFPKKIGETVPFKFTEWARQYGDIISVKTMSQTMIILSSATAVREVIDKTGWISGSRNPSYLVDLCAGGVDHILFTGDTPQLKAMRKALGSFFSKQNTSKNLPILSESAQLLYDLMEDPADFRDSVRRFTHSIIKTLIYGQRAPVFNSPDVAQFFKTMAQLEHILSPGVFPPIDLIPVLKFIPKRLAPWIPAARALQKERELIHRKMYADVQRRSQKRMEEEKGEEGNTRCFLETVNNQPELDQEFVSYTALVSIDGGSDSSSSLLLSIILALASNPIQQERAWRELDSVVGGRLPESDDIERMPFVKALIKEIQRMRAPFPIGFPHATTKDIRYKDFLIPKGTSVILNNYAITNDPEIFENPEEFNPDRFLKTEFGTIPGKDKDFRDSYMFGGGRRICPGQWVARYTMDLTTMRLIWAFQFSDAIESKSKRPIPPGIAAEYFNWELVTRPHPFECTIEARPDRAQAIRDNYIAALSELQKFEVDLLPSDQERMETLRKELQLI
ncbi:cytochrome P450 [Hymenopellis radicata]|nr:cytochrome P450 [Hymenopellis radicata]